MTLASILTALFALLVGPLTAAPHNGDLFKLKQPDGTFVEVKVWGDEFYQRVESLDGYTLIRDPKTRWICYAELSDDESDFVSTDIVYQGLAVAKNAIPKSRKNGLPLAKKLKLKKKAIKKKADRARKLLLGDAIASGPDDAVQRKTAASAPAAPLSGSVLGLTLLIDFPDVPGTITRNDVNDYANLDGYSGYGNNGSVMNYFEDISNGSLDYTNHVVEYYTASHNKSYYTNESISYGTRAKELIDEALDDLDDLGFDFSILSTDASDYILAINAFYAGEADNAWAQGLWPHQGWLNSRTFDGVTTRQYQISNMGNALGLSIFCHENGHMICDWPDLYDYGGESSGAGNYCLMAEGASANSTNPVPPNPHYRNLKGWETVIEISTDLLGTLRTHIANSFTTYRYSHPSNPKEFFLIESRIKSGRNDYIPDEGLLIWHIDEDGSNQDEQMTPARHYMVSVEQADGQFHLEMGNNRGGGGDLFHAGYKDAFNDYTLPDARWWSGEESYLSISDISAAGASMSFVGNIDIDDCMVKLIMGLREATDLVGNDCITDLADLSEMLETWTVDNALTVPMAKEQDPGPRPEVVTYDFDDGTLQGWSNFEGATEDFVVVPGHDAIPALSPPNIVEEAVFYEDRDTDTNVSVLTSPAFGISETSSVEIWALGGAGAVDTPTWTNIADLPAVAGNDFMGAALRRMSDGEYLLFGRRSESNEWAESWEDIGWDTPTITAAVAVAGDSPSEQYVVDLIDTFSGVWGWISFDDITSTGDFGDNFNFNPSPSDGAYVEPSSELELSWGNMDPNMPGDPVYVDVWFGTDPNDYNDFNKIVNAVEDANSVTVDASTVGTYYWQVNWYIYGSATGDPIEGAMLSFHAATDVPVSVEAGVDMVTWSGESVALAASVDDDGESALTIAWSADPTGVVVFDPNEFVEDPTVTITPWSYSAAGIVNPGFEDPVLADGDSDFSMADEGWGYFNNAEWLGPWNPGPGYYGGIAPEGQNIGWALPHEFGGAGGFAQILTETLAPETTYILTVEVGNSDNVYGYTFGGYKVQLLAGGSQTVGGDYVNPVTGGTVLAKDNDSLTPWEYGTFVTSTVTHTSGREGSDPNVGENLQIRLLAFGIDWWNQTHFDDVRLTANPPFPPTTTGAQTVTLTVLVQDGVSSDEDIMTIDVYDNPCVAAIIGLGQEYDPGDLDKDCDTDLKDYAAMAKAWLVDYTLTEPAAQ